ncbi:MAG: hypothetical protein IJY93_09980 [Clostridia bacterium]|nr:hypothetical protein [Clostridia bacterium]
MVHTFKFGGQRIAYDNVSGLVLPLSELAYKMLDYIELPMPKECSSALRYDLAKYDSAAIGETYNELYALYRDGKLFAEGKGESETVHGGAAIKVGDTVCTRTDPHIFDIVKKLAEDGEDVTISIVDSPENLPAFTEEDVPTIARQLEKIAKEQVKRARAGADEKPFTAFEKHIPATHDEESCAGCWAFKLCSLASAQNAKCELEKKRIECVMMCETAAK